MNQDRGRRRIDRRAVVGVSAVAALVIGFLAVRAITAADRVTVRAVDDPPTTATDETARDTIPTSPTEPVSTGGTEAGAEQNTDSSLGESAESVVSGTEAVVISTGPDWPEELPDPPTVRRWHAAAAGTGKGLLIWGGTTPSWGGENEPPFELLGDGAWFDVATGAWRTVAPSPLAGGRATAVAVGGDLIVVLAAGTLAVYDPTLDAWTPLPAPPVPLDEVEELIFDDGDVLALPSNQRLDLATGQWTSFDLVPVGVIDPVFAAGDGNVFAVVLTSIRPDFDEAQAFTLDRDSGRWTAVGSPQRSDRFSRISATVADGRLIVATGVQIAAYDLSSGDWSTPDSIPGIDAYCEWDVGAIADAALFTGGCGSVALTAGGWRSLPRTFWSDPLRMVSLGDVGVVVGGHVITSANLDDPRPWRLDSVTIAAGVAAGVVRNGATLSTDLDDGRCWIVARQRFGTGSPDGSEQRTLAEALKGGEPFRFWNPSHNPVYQLTCDDPSRYRYVADRLAVAGEGTTPIDLPDGFVGTRFDPSRLDTDLNLLTPLVVAHGAEIDPLLKLVGSGWGGLPVDGRMQAVVDLGPADGNTTMHFDFALVAGADGVFVIERATRRTICPLGVDFDDPTICRSIVIS